MGYARPTDAPISATWQDHRNRTPPSSEPGTDYACAYGTPVGCAESGTVTAVNTSPSGGTGRYVTVGLDDGRVVRYLHLSACWVGVGWRVPRGGNVGASGASGYGDDWYYGPHVHTTLWERAGLPVGDTIDFENYVSGEDEDMNSEQDNRLRNIENLLLVPGAGYGYPGAIMNELRDSNAPILGGVKDTQARLGVPGAGYDWLPAINNKVDRVWNAAAAGAVAAILLVVAVVSWVRR